MLARVLNLLAEVAMTEPTLTYCLEVLERKLHRLYRAWRIANYRQRPTIKEEINRTLETKTALVNCYNKERGIKPREVVEEAEDLIRSTADQHPRNPDAH